jgi:predicted phosphodiesterase
VALPIPPRLRHAFAAWILPGLIGLTGAWLALEAFGTSTVTAGPFQVNLDADFGRGLTDIGLPPLGRLQADTHLGPLHVRADLHEIDVDALRTELSEGGLEGLAQTLETRTLDHLLPFGLRIFAIGVAGGVALGLLAFRAVPRRVEVAGLTALVVVAGSIGLSVATYDPRAFLSPTYSGTLSLAPKLFGPVRGTIERVGYFRDQLQSVVAGAARAYAAVEANPFGATPEISVLHISDVHLSTLGMDFAQELARSFDVDLVLDTGDTSSFGTEAEAIILQTIPGFDRPYVWVRGNHDSLSFQQAVGSQPNAEALDGETADVRGLTIYGLGDPYFNQERGAPVEDDAVVELIRSAGPRVLADVEAASRPPDIVAVHDRRMAETVAGRVPLVVSGHFHSDAVEVRDGTIFLQVGSSGGAGPTGFANEPGEPFSAEILYFRPGLIDQPPALVAWDLITQDPATGSLQIERHVVELELGLVSPSPSAPASPTTATGPTVSPTPAEPAASP